MMMKETIFNSLINDSSKVTFIINDNDTWEEYTIDYHLVVSLVVCLLGTTGNGLVIWFCLFRMEKTVNVVWFLNLAIADFIFALYLSLIFINTTLDGHWPLRNYTSEITCFLVFYVIMAITVLQLTVISVDRCICVIFPGWCRKHRTRRFALIVVLIIWIISISSHLITYSYGDRLYHTTSCLAIARIFFFFLLPFIIIIMSFTVLVLHIKHIGIIKSSKPIKAIIAMVIAYFICWFPYQLFVLVKILLNRNTKNDCILVTELKISAHLMLFICCINPILYIFIGRDAKQKLCGSFQTIFKKVFREDMSQMIFHKREQCSSSRLVPKTTNTRV